MDSNRNKVVDVTSVQLLSNGCPLELGMPAKLIQELVFGKYPALTVEDVFGLSERFRGTSMLEEYMDKLGYPFSWGTVSEESRPSDPDDDESPHVLRYEVVPINLLLVFPQSAQLEDLFMWLYENHPLYSPDFDCDEGFEDWSVISFQSKEGEEEVLRSWMADTFISLIWPDLLTEATKIVAEKIAAAIVQSPEGSIEELLVERGRFQLCGDPAKLSYYAGE